MWNKISIPVLLLMALPAVGLLHAQATANDASSSVKIDLPADSPVTLISYSMGQTHVTARGGAMVLDLDMSLTLRNNDSGARSVRDVMLLITAQEFTPGGKGSVARPSIDVPAGQNFTLPIKLRLIRPVQQANGPVRVQLDGVLFNDLSFYGPNRLNSQRAMTLWEVEAQRDRAYYKQILQAKGETGLQKEILNGMKKASEHPQLDVALSHTGRTVGSAAANLAADSTPADKAHFAFLELPDSPVLAVQGQADIKGNEVRSPWIEVQNLDKKKAVRYVEIGWVVKDKEGNEYLVGSVPGSGVSALNTSGAGPNAVIQAGQRGRLEPDATLRFSHAGRPVAIDGMTGFVTQVEFADGKVWVPSRKDLDSSPLLRSMSPSTEEQRLLDIYAKQGLNALVADLAKY
jgi:hypothetical protein